LEPYMLALVLDSLILLALGLIDFLRGESSLGSVIAAYLAGLSVYPLLPLPWEGKAILFALHLALLAVMAVLYATGRGLGSMDFVIAPHAPLTFPALHMTTLLPGLVAALLGLLLHSYRARKYVCHRGLPIPGTVVGVKGWLAWDKWYFIPSKVRNPEKEEEVVRREKERWRNRKRCESARFAIPLVWVYALYHAGVILSLALYTLLGAEPA